MTEAEIDYYAQVIWDYMLLKEQPIASDLIFVPCSLDTRVAEYAAQLLLERKGKYLLFSGNGKGRITEYLFEKPEADTFADIARMHGVPENRILIENKANDTGQNIRFSYALLKKKNLLPQSLLIVQKPYMERRVKATFEKQWPDRHIKLTVVSPPIPYHAYFNATNNKKFVIESMVGDLQRLKVYARKGFLTPQHIPKIVEEAYTKLVDADFTRRLLPEA